MPIAETPCLWPNNASICCSDWDTFSPEAQQQGLDYATYILWAATGRQYGLCEMTVRPCGRKCSNCPNGWYYDGDGGTWMPYNWFGEWRNCWCGGNGPGGCCTCDPDCQVYLPGPVNSILGVRVNGASLPVTGSDGTFNYFVLDQQWLVRVDTQACWPLCSDQNLAPGSPDAFEVTYLRGLPVPRILANVVGVLACEYARACLGLPCRLPGRATNISRQGVTVSMVPIEELLHNGFTGLFEVDQVIASMNPYGVRGRTRFYSPDFQEGRQITYP